VWYEREVKHKTFEDFLSIAKDKGILHGLTDFASLLYSLLPHASIGRRNTCDDGYQDDSMFQTAETLARGESGGVMCKDVDFVYSKLGISKVDLFLATEAEQRQKLCESIRARKISNKIDQRRAKFSVMSVKLLQQMLSDAGVSGKYKSADKKRLVDLAVDNRIQIPGDSPYNSDPEAENMQFFDKNGRRLEYRKLAVAVKMPQIQSDSGENHDCPSIKGCAGGGSGDIESSDSERENDTTSTTRPPVSPKSLSPEAHPSAEGESRFQVSPYSEIRDKQPLMDLLCRRYGWTSGPVGRKMQPYAFIKSGDNPK
jgi:hypothetical protein